MGSSGCTSTTMPLPAAVQAHLSDIPPKEQYQLPSRLSKDPIYLQATPQLSTDEEAQILAEINEGHTTISTTLGARLINLKATRVVISNGLDAVLTNVTRVNDASLLVDLSKYIADELSRKSGKETTSLGSCLELLPLVENLIQAPYEEYICAGLNIVHAIVTTWGNELRETSPTLKDIDPRNAPSINLHSVSMKLLNMHTAVEKLAKRSDTPISHLAKQVEEKLSKIY